MVGTLLVHHGLMHIRVEVGAKGHINVGAGFGEWNEGLELLKRLD